MPYARPYTYYYYICASTWKVAWQISLGISVNFLTEEFTESGVATILPPFIVSWSVCFRGLFAGKVDDGQNRISTAYLFIYLNVCFVYRNIFKKEEAT